MKEQLVVAGKEVAFGSLCEFAVYSKLMFRLIVTDPNFLPFKYSILYFSFIYKLYSSDE